MGLLNPCRITLPIGKSQELPAHQDWPSLIRLLANLEELEDTARFELDDGLGDVVLFNATERSQPLLLPRECRLHYMYSKSLINLPALL